MKTIIQFVIMFAFVSSSVSMKADTIYSNNFVSAESVSDWTLSDDNQFYNYVSWTSGSLYFFNLLGEETSPYAILPTLPIGVKGLGIFVSTTTDNLELQTSYDGIVYTNQGTLSSSTSKSMPDSTRFVKITMSNSTTGILNSIAIVGYFEGAADSDTTTLWDGTVADWFAGGKGTKEAPYLISTPRQLAFLSSMTNGSYDATAGKFYKLTKNIDLNGKPWIPIGRDYAAFKGSFDGAGHEIRGLYVDTTYSVKAYFGLFGYMRNGTIRNLGIGDNSTVNGDGAYMAGSIVGYAYESKIIGCYNHGTVNGGGGGIAGYGQNVLISDCYNTGNITSKSYAGGIIGDMSLNAVVQFSYNTGDIESYGFSGALVAPRPGGITGYGAGKIRHCYNRGNIKAVGVSANPYGGGIAGTTGGSIQNAYTTGNVNVTTAYNTCYGGFIAGAATANLITSTYYLSTAQLTAINKTNFGAAMTTQAALLSNLNGTPSSNYWKADTDNENDGYPVLNYVPVVISFETYGGNALDPVNALIWDNFEDVDLPTPVRTGCTFEGWYLNPELTQQLNPASAIGANDLTLYAKWQLTITFDANGGTVSPATMTYTADSAFRGVFPIPERLGFIFMGWSGDASHTTLMTPDSTAHYSTTFYARWGVNIRFNTHGGDALDSRNYVSGLSFGLTPNDGLPTPTKAGYVFGSWYTDLVYENQYINSDIVPLDRQDTLYAKWGGTVIVAFDPNNGGEIIEKEYYPLRAYNASVNYEGTVYNNGFPANPSESGALFMGWYDASLTEQTFTSSLVPNYPHTLYAKWNRKITINFETSGGTQIASREYYPDYTYSGSGNPGLPANPTRENSLFLGWYDNPDLRGSQITASSYVDSETTTLYAKWSTKITINFVTNNTSTIEPVSLYFGYAYNSSQNSYYTLKTPTKIGDSVFAGWYGNPDFSGIQITSASSVDSETTTLYAKWNTKITVNFVTGNASTIDPVQLYSGFTYNSSQNNYYTLPTPTKIGDSIFVGWYEDPDFSGYKVTSTNFVEPTVTTLYAKWGTKNTITFETNGGTTIAPKAYYTGFAYNASAATSGVNNGLPSNPAKANSFFLGWYDSPDFTGYLITATSEVEPSITTLYAKWSERITIQFETYGGTSIASRTYYPDFAFSNSSPSNAGLPGNPTKDSARFIGWYDNPDFSGSSITNTSYVYSTMTTLYARWAEKVWVTFIDYTEDTFQRKAFYHNLTYNTTPNTSLPNPIPSSKPGFLGWFHDIVNMQNQIQNSDLVPDHNVMLHARWCVEVSFETNGGTPIADKIYTPGIPYNESPNDDLPIAFRTGYSFDGWFFDAACTQPVTSTSIVFDGTHRLYAGWKAQTKPKYTVTITPPTNGTITVKAGATTITSGTELDSATVLTLTAVPNANYKFDNWWDNDITNPRSFTLTKNTTISAAFKVSNLPVTGVSLNKTSTAMLVGGSEQLVVTVTPSDAGNKNVSWKSSDSTIAKTSANGLITAVAVGTATITVTTQDGGKTAQCVVTVSATAVAVTTVSLNKNTTALTVGETEQLTTIISPANATNQNVSWASNKTNVATVSANGLISALSPGTATITVTTQDGGKTAQCVVTVTAGTGIADREQNLTLKLYPNPIIDGKLIVEAPDNIEDNYIRIYNFSGKLVLLQVINRPRTEINVSDLPNGLYIVRTGNYSAKIVKR